MNSRMLGLWALLAGLLGPGCGGGGGDGSGGLVGVWVVESSVNVCAVGFSFGPGGEYQASELCVLTSGALAIEGERGTYEVVGGTIHFMPEQYTCAGSDPAAWSLDFELRGNTLRLESPQGVILAERTEQSGDGNLAARYGCFDAGGTFTPGAWQPV